MPTTSTATPLSARALARIAASIGSDPPLGSLPHDAGPRRRWALVEEERDYQAWIVAWPVRAALALHDHDGAAAGVRVVAGRLDERVLGTDGRSTLRAWTPGATFELPPEHVHDVRSVGDDEAVTIHVYSPRLTDVRFRSPSAIDRQLDEVRGRIGRVDAATAARLHAAGALLVDTRPAWQRERFGALPGAVEIERNHLEWRLDPTSGHPHPAVVDHRGQIVVLCQEGYASSLAVDALTRLGVADVLDLEGGFEAWTAAGLPMVTPD